MSRKRPGVEILVVGDEILSGQTTDTNSGYAARQLRAAGLEVTRVTEVGDREDAIQSAAAEAIRRARVLVVTGGLGPTPDDLTKEAFATLFGDALEMDEPTLDEIRSRFARRGLKMTENNRKQALLPRTAQKIPNPMGSAPGVHWQRQECDVFLLPGVPGEMRAMLDTEVIPRLRGRVASTAIQYAVFRTTALPESEVAQRLQPEIDKRNDLRWAFYPGRGSVDVHVVQSSGSEAGFRAACDAVRKRLGAFLYSETPGESLAEVVVRLLTRNGHRIAVAESCTGGLLGARITSVPGSSTVFVGGFVTYDNAAKRDWLAVPEALLQRHGAVSAEVAVAMAQGARERGGADVALAITGIAGPSGGSEEKPVGLIYLALADAGASWTRKLQLGPHRDLNRTLAAQLALDMLRRYETGLPHGERT
jgi:nicotinamide-nucleotide amidase